MAPNPEQIERLKNYRQQALKRLRNPRTRRYVAQNEYERIWEIVFNYCTNSAIAYQIDRDLKIYLLYDALAMWLDHENGLAAYDPDLIIRIGEYLLERGDE